jgi:hypothetical protein
MSDFPPKCASDIEDYDLEETVAGYSDTSDIEPGANNSPAYRWGWTNRKRDRLGKDDGFDGLRHDYLRWRKSLSPRER